MAKIWVYEWIEFERGWGQRPDGFSLHLTRQAGLDYVKACWAGMPKEVPHEYDKPATQNPLELEVEELLVEWVAAGDRRLWKSGGKISGKRFDLAPEMRAKALDDLRSAIDEAAAPGVERAEGKRPAL